LLSISWTVPVIRSEGAAGMKSRTAIAAFTATLAMCLPVSADIIQVTAIGRSILDINIPVNIPDLEARWRSLRLATIISGSSAQGWTRI
jgi:hypothetical protein